MTELHDPERCSYCGCVLQYRPSLFKESLATPTQQRAIQEEEHGPDRWERIRERIAAYGFRETWGIAFSCPGCGMHGGTLRREYSLAEAEQVSDAQNRAAETPEALALAAGWEQEVRRRAERDAELFRKLLLDRFPEWEPHVRLVPAGDPAIHEGPEGLEWDCALVATIPPENPAVDMPLDIRVLGAEVRPSWFDGWHYHFHRLEDVAPGDPEHLERAFRMVDDLVSERLLVTILYRDDQPAGGGNLPAGQDPPENWWASDGSEGASRLILRSWRGTYDRVIERA